jgi:histidinol-phosphate phosphatase family protein
VNITNIQAVFIDRDGTIGGADNHVVYPGEFELYPYSMLSFKLLKEAGKSIFSFTNQPGISKGEAKIIDFEEELTTFGFSGIYICPHSLDEGCDCRKPSIGMLLNASKDHDLDLSKCVIIGDRWTDMLAAQNAGSIKILVKTGSGLKDLSKYNNNEFFGNWAEVHLDYIAEDLLDAANWIIKLENSFKGTPKKDW